MKYRLLIGASFFMGLALLAGGFLLLHGDGLDVEALLGRYGYLLVLLWTGFHGMSIVIVAGAFSQMLELDPWWIILCAFIGGSLSDQLIFIFCRYRGDTILQRFPKFSEKIKKTAHLFESHSSPLILFSRFIYGMRNITPVFFGINGISARKFFFLNFVGAFIWAVGLTYGGFYTGQAFFVVMEQLGKGIFYAVLTVLLLAALWIVGSRRRFTRNELLRSGEEDP